MNAILTQYNGMILGPIAKVLGYILNGIYSFFSMLGFQNAGFSIIVFTFIVNALMIPITFKQQKFSKMNSVMAPELQAIKDKYKNKKDQDSTRRMQAEQQEVYQKYGVSPTAGCLPLLITLPIFFALYRVIYNIPAYVPQIKEIYEGIIDSVAKSGMDIGTFAHNLAAFVKGNNITDVTINSSLITSQALPKAEELVSAISEFTNGAFSSTASNYIVDILSQFRQANWTEFLGMKMFADFPAVKTTISEAYTRLSGIYNFLGMNIMESPGWYGFEAKTLTILVPVFAVVTQFINNRIMTVKTPKNKDGEKDATSSSMNMMNNIMPFVSGAFCFMFPIGVGLYWVAGSVFRIIQGICINKYFDKVGMDKVLEKNFEKQNKKLAKKGVNVNSTKMQELAKSRTSSIKADQDKETPSRKYVNKETQSHGKNDLYINKNIKSGASISDYANMLNRNYAVEDSNVDAVSEDVNNSDVNSNETEQ